jgi:hypothetical protein
MGIVMMAVVNRVSMEVPKGRESNQSIDESQGSSGMIEEAKKWRRNVIVDKKERRYSKGAVS